LIFPKIDIKSIHDQYMGFLGQMATKHIGFTANKIKDLQCEDGKSQTIHWDIKTPSLGLRVTPTGNRAYIFQTWFNGTNLRLTIGDIETWTLGAAQAEARRLKVLTDQGTDPRVERAKTEAENKASRLKGTSGLVVWGEYIKARQHQWGDRHKAEHLYMVRQGGEKITRGLRSGQSDIKQKGILLDLLSFPINEITRDKVAALVKREAKTRPAGARKALSALKAFLTWASDQTDYKALVDKEACDRLSKELPPKQVKNDCLQKEQLKVWFDAVKKIGNPVIGSYLQVLLLTGARRNELATLEWADVDIQWHTARIKDKVEGSRTIPLTPYVEWLIDNLPRRGKYVFASPTAKSGRLTEPRKAHQVVIEEAGIPNLSIHGLRRSFSTLSEWVECPSGVVAQIMGHKPSAVAERHYIRRPIDLLRKFHNQIEKFILDEAGILQPSEGRERLRVVKN
jgi:integrase